MYVSKIRKILHFKKSWQCRSFLPLHLHIDLSNYHLKYIIQNISEEFEKINSYFTESLEQLFEDGPAVGGVPAFSLIITDKKKEAKFEPFRSSFYQNYKVNVWPGETQAIIGTLIKICEKPFQLFVKPGFRISYQRSLFSSRKGLWK